MEKQLESFFSLLSAKNVTIASDSNEWVDNFMRNIHLVGQFSSGKKKQLVGIFSEYQHWNADRLLKYYLRNTKRLINLTLRLEFDQILFPDRQYSQRRNVAQKLIRFSYRKINSFVSDIVKPIKSNYKQGANTVRQLIRRAYMELKCINPRLNRMGNRQMESRVPIEPLLDQMLQVANSRGKK